MGSGLRRIAWGATLMILSPLAFVLALVPLGVGTVLVAIGAWRASKQSIAFLVGGFAAPAFAALVGLGFWIVLGGDMTWMGVASILAALSLGTMFAAIGEGHARRGQHRWTQAARFYGWVTDEGTTILAPAFFTEARKRRWAQAALIYGRVTAAGAVMLASAFLMEFVRPHGSAIESMLYRFSLPLVLIGAVASIVCWHVLAAPSADSFEQDLIVMPALPEARRV